MTTIDEVLKALQAVTNESGDFNLRWDATRQCVELTTRFIHDDGRIINNAIHIDKSSLDESFREVALNYATSRLFAELKEFLDKGGT